MIGQEPRLVYQRLREKFGGYRRAPRKEFSEDSAAFGPGRDPGSVADAFDTLSESMGWGSHLAQADLLEQWADIVGDDIASHATPLGIDTGVLEVACDSSAWATQLRLMRVTLLNSVVERFPGAGIVDITVKAPGAPSWKHGPRSVPGRGPRDTYG